MAYTRVYPTRINWENEPSINTPINEVNLNKTDYALYQIDGTLANWDTIKANQSDLLLSVKSVDYDTETGVFVFTWQNGTTKTIDLNIEKIPVSFSMSPAGVITMTTEDGSTYTADVGALIKTYTFTDSSVIDFTVTADSDGNKTVTADIVDGSITGQKLQPNYLADCQSAKSDAETAEVNAEDSAEDSEAWANGTRNGVPVPDTDPAYHNNSKYWSEQSNPTSLVGLTDTDINNPINGQTLIYNSATQKWENRNGGSASLAGLSDVDLATPIDGQVLTYDSVNQKWVNADIGANGGSNITVTTTEATLYGESVTISDGVTTLTETFSSSGVAVFEGVTMTGQLTVASGSYSTPLNVPYFGNYEAVISAFTASITVTFPADSTCTCTKSGETQTAYVSPHTFYVHSTGTYTITATDGTHTKSDTVTITTDGQSESVTLTYVPDGSTVLPTDDIQIWLNCADIYDKTSYTTLSDVLADSTTLAALIADNNAVDYMVRSKSWAKNVNLVPKMTTNTTPSGICVGNSIYNSSTDYFKSFDGDNASNWSSAVGSAPWYIGYIFDNPICIKKVRVYVQSSGRPKTSKIQGSNDTTNGTDGTWTDIGSFADCNAENSWFESTYPNNNVTYRAYRLYITEGYTSNYASMTELQFYAYEYDGNGITEDSTAMSYIGLNNYCANTLLADSDWDTAIQNSAYFESIDNVKVPTMTDNTHPSGIVSQSSYQSGYLGYKAFDGVTSDEDAWIATTSANERVTYQFPTSVCIKKVVFTPRAYANSTYMVSDYKIQGSNDGSTYTDLYSGTNTNGTNETTVILNNTTNYEYISFLGINCTNNSGRIALKECQFYGRIDV